MSLYLTVNEFKQAPTAIDTNTLDQTNIGNQSAQDAALLNVLRRASAWVDTICRMDTLEASVNTEQKEVNVLKDGRITVHVENTPIIQVTDVEYMLSPYIGFQPVDLNYIVQYENWFSVYQFTTNSLSPTLMLQNVGYVNPFLRQNISNTPITIKYTYVNGFMNSTLTTASKANDTSITVVDATGAYAGLKFTIYDGYSEENVVVQSVSGNVITLTKPLIFAHAIGTPASAIPATVKQATLLLASYLIKERGSLAVMMNETAVSGTTMGYNKSSDIETAKELLRDYIRWVSS